MGINYAHDASLYLYRCLLRAVLSLKMPQDAGAQFWTLGASPQLPGTKINERQLPISECIGRSIWVPQY